MAIKVARKAAREYLDVRTGTFLRKLRRKDADAQMAFCAAAEDVGADSGLDIDMDFIMQLLELVMELIESLRRIFDW
jgi:hypothetical protein